MNTSTVTTTHTTTSRRTRRVRTTRLHLSCRILGHTYRRTPGDPDVLTCVGCGNRELRVVKQIRDNAQRLGF
ncbi:hypothetical protein [Terrabacter sp. C0L_2]|uniref:hypothetical protein n=1 Tax=Terrabacter sp. C0L_2 TaxID=3108389 RepID=UPI002ED5CD04|nr:hypothetical protein U5C87_21010 [Terrabacter sp. C0L_2]